jgi:class 3 adenylate cyclase/tetratricopeptide (TPR) repeat protein
MSSTVPVSPKSQKATCPLCGGEPDPAAGRAASASAELVDEIRTVTVLFADVAGSTEMTAQLGLEAVKGLMDRVFDRIYRVVLEHGGKVDKFIGDCVMALFGAPLAYGDDPARAVRAGLTIVKAVAQMEEELRADGLPPVRMRVGINTGPVITGPVGAGPERRYTVLGHAVNLAAHLQQEAPVGGVLVGEGTYRRIRGLFNLRELKERSADAEAGRAYLVDDERTGGLWLRPREILGKEIEMVGRDVELKHLLDLAAACRETPESRLLLLVGEPGIGKSRLAFEFLSRLEHLHPDTERVVSLAHPISSGIPFSVAADAMRRRLGINTGQPPEQVVGRVRVVLETLGRPQLEKDLRAVTHILGLPADERDPDEASSPRQVLDLMVQLIDRLTSRPTVVVADDLHWADDSSLTLIEHILEQLPDRPLLIVGLVRPEYLLQKPEQLKGPRRNRLDLGPLDHHSVSLLVRQAVGELSDDELLDLISSRALGNPYHAEELLRALEERGVLVRRVGGWDLTAFPADLGILPGVEAVTQARIDNLTADQRRALCHSAAIGRTFWDGLVRSLDEDFAPKDLSVLVERELVVSRQGSTFPDNKEYIFVHDLTRDVAYRMLTEQRRTELHQRIAAWILAQGASGAEQLALVGGHLDLGGRPEEAATYLCRAGDAAFGAAAYPTAALHYSRAIELALSPALQFDLLARRERVLNALGRWNEQRTDAARMLELAVELDEEERRVEALLRVGRALLNLGLHGEAKSAFEEAQERAMSLGDPASQARSLRWLAMYHFNRSEHLQARELFEHALRLAEEHGLADLEAELGYELGVTAGTVGDYERALDVSSQALAQFREQGNRYQESYCLANIGCFHIYLGEYNEAVPALERAAELGREMRIPLAEASAQANLGNAYRLLGRTREALALERRAHQVAEEIGDQRLAADALIYGALAALDAEPKPDETPDNLARELAEEALALASKSGMVGTEAIARMALARVLCERQIEAAYEHSRQAVVILDRIGTVEGFEQEILQVHGDICARSDRCDEAEQHHTRAKREVDRKATFIRSERRRENFIERALHHPIVEGQPKRNGS